MMYVPTLEQVDIVKLAEFNRKLQRSLKVTHLQNNKVNFKGVKNTAKKYIHLSGWVQVPIGVYTPMGSQYLDWGIISCIFSPQNTEKF